jgi:flavin-dependent thymidylate synthase
MENKVELIGWYGGDRAIARAAWTSTSIDVDSRTDEQIRNLIVNKLWNNGTGKPHKTPFERGTVEWLITCDTASHIHLLKHRLANINGESARYQELKEDKYCLPKDWKDIPTSNEFFNFLIKQGFDEHSIDFSAGPVKDCPNTWTDVLEWYTKLGNALYHDCLKDLAPVLGRKRAKESARFFKTYNSQITLSVMMNMSCFHNFVKLRVSDEAQVEIREIGTKMVELVKQIPENPFKYTLEAFGL